MSWVWRLKNIGEVPKRRVEVEAALSFLSDRSSKLDSYQGMPSGVPPRAQVECAGFSRRAVTGGPGRLKPFRIVAFGGIAKAMP